MTFRAVVPHECQGWRLDAALAQLIPHLSKRAARRAVDAGAVYVDDVRTRHQSKAVSQGQMLRVEEQVTPQQVPLPFSMLHTDVELAVVDKPAGMPTEATRQGVSGTLREELRMFLRARVERQGEAGFLAAAHRLDVDTSGVVVFARSPAAAAHLSAQFREGTVQRGYLAVVQGVVLQEKWIIDAPLSRKVDRAGKIHVVASGLPSQTQCLRIASSEQASLLCVWPHTGRTHQIRVHLAHVGHPLVGDRRYGNALRENPHLGLHASSLSFRHPSDERVLLLRSPAPASFVAACVVFGITPDDVVRAADVCATGRQSA